MSHFHARTGLSFHYWITTFGNCSNGMRLREPAHTECLMSDAAGSPFEESWSIQDTAICHLIRGKTSKAPWTSSPVSMNLFLQHYGSKALFNLFSVPKCWSM